jgi:hypothetical protein
MSRSIRLSLTLLATAIGLTAMAGGFALVLGTVDTSNAGGIAPDYAFLEGSPFTSYLVPGLLLAIVIGGLHLLAAFMLGRGSRFGPLAAAVAAFGLLIWIFVQMVFIPFSPLQAIYFVAGLGELGFVLLILGLLHRPVLSRS